MKMTAKVAIESTERILDFNSNLQNGFDKNHSALSTASLNINNTLGELHTRLPYLKPYMAVVEDDPGDKGLGSSCITAKANVSKDLRLYDGPIEWLIPNIKFKGTKLSLLRICLDSPQLMDMDGFGLPSTKIARQLGRRQPQISRDIKYFVNRGWLVPLNDGRYWPGRRAIHYVAARELKLALELRFPHILMATLPSSIEDGAWNETLGEIVGKLYRTRTLEQVLSLVRKIKGSEKGDRLRQARNWYLWYLKRGAA